MAYMLKKFICGKVIEFIKYFTRNAQGKNTVRAPKTKITNEAQKKLNEKNAIDHLRRLINTNFRHNDLWLSFTYNKNIVGELSPEEAKEIFEKRFLKNLRRAYKRAGLELKYIHITEVGSSGSVHHHMVCNHIDPRVIAELWKYGFVDVKFLDASGQYEKIAKYMVKYTAANYDNPEQTFCKRRFNPSKNLKKPIVKTRLVKANSWREEPVAKKGYKITECYAGVSETTGYPYQFYTMVEIPLYRGYSLPEEMHKEKKNRRRSAGSTRKRRKGGNKITEDELF